MMKAGTWKFWWFPQIIEKIEAAELADLVDQVLLGLKSFRFGIASTGSRSHRRCSPSWISRNRSNAIEKVANNQTTTPR